MVIFWWSFIVYCLWWYLWNLDKSEETYNKLLSWPDRWSLTMMIGSSLRQRSFSLLQPLLIFSHWEWLRILTTNMIKWYYINCLHCSFKSQNRTNVYVHNKVIHQNMRYFLCKHYSFSASQITNITTLITRVHSKVPAIQGIGFVRQK